MNSLSKVSTFSTTINRLCCTNMPKGSGSAASKSKQKQNRSTSKEDAAVAGTPPLTLTKNGEVAIPLQVKPGSKFNCITDVSAEAVSLQISAPPVDGEANLAIVKFFSDVLGVKKGDIQLSGVKSKQKTLFVTTAGTDHNCQSILDLIRTKIGNQY